MTAKDAIKEWAKNVILYAKEKLRQLEGEKSQIEENLKNIESEITKMNAFSGDPASVAAHASILPHTSSMQQGQDAASAFSSSFSMAAPASSHPDHGVPYQALGVSPVYPFGAAPAFPSMQQRHVAASVYPSSSTFAGAHYPVDHIRARAAWGLSQPHSVLRQNPYSSSSPDAAPASPDADSSSHSLGGAKKKYRKKTTQKKKKKKKYTRYKNKKKRRNKTAKKHKNKSNKNKKKKKNTRQRILKKKNRNKKNKNNKKKNKK